MSLLRRLHFDLWYFFRPPWDTGVSPPELLQYLEMHPPGRAVDLGCGTGTNVLTIAKHGWQVTGLDFSKRAIHIAQDKARRAGVSARLLVSDLSERLDLRGRFDLALDVGCFHAVGNRLAYLANMLTILEAGGNWLLYAFLRASNDRARVGLSTADLDYVASRGLRLVERADGSERRGRPSAWFLFQKPILPG